MQTMLDKYAEAVLAQVKIPEKLRGMYCLVFGDRVIHSTDTLEAALEYQRESSLFLAVLGPLPVAPKKKKEPSFKEALLKGL
jgi:hypothetical protein